MRRTAYAIVMLCATGGAIAGNIDTKKSTITATFRQMHVPVEGAFKRFDGNIDFDEKNVTNSHARIEVDTASFDVGADDYNDELHKREWFDTAHYPRATFIARRVAANAKGFEAIGDFTLKGKTQTLTVPFTRTLESGVAVFTGEWALSRKVFAIGDASWDGTVDDRVVVKFRLVRPQKLNVSPSQTGKE